MEIWEVYDKVTRTRNQRQLWLYNSTNLMMYGPHFSITFCKMAVLVKYKLQTIKFVDTTKSWSSLFFTNKFVTVKHQI